MSISHQEYLDHKSAVWRATLILSIVTIIEVGVALLYNWQLHDSGLRMGLNFFMIIATLVKAFYIVAVFMHMKYERQALVLTVLMPLFFLIWFIIAFFWEGTYWQYLQSTLT